MTKEEIVEALSKLDPAVDEHWTADGLPKIEAVGAVKRKDLMDAAPHFSRSTPMALVNKLEEEREDVTKELAEATLASYDAKKRYDKALAAHDAMIRKFEEIRGARTAQHDIMDYLAANKKLAHGGNVGVKSALGRSPITLPLT